MCNVLKDWEQMRLEAGLCIIFYFTHFSTTAVTHTCTFTHADLRVPLTLSALHFYLALQPKSDH